MAAPLGPVACNRMLRARKLPAKCQLEGRHPRDKANESGSIATWEPCKLRSPNSSGCWKHNISFCLRGLCQPSCLPAPKFSRQCLLGSGQTTRLLRVPNKWTRQGQGFQARIVGSGRNRIVMNQTECSPVVEKEKDTDSCQPFRAGNWRPIDFKGC